MAPELAEVEDSLPHARRVDTFAQRVDDPRSLVAQHHGRFGRIGVEALPSRDLGKIDPASLGAYAHLAGLRLGVIRLPHLEHTTVAVACHPHRLHGRRSYSRLCYRGRGMQVVSLAPVPVASLKWRMGEGAWTLSVVCKLSLSLEQGEAEIAKRHDPIYDEDKFPDDDDTASLYAPCDLVPARKLVDVMVVGNAYAPRGGSVKSL